MNINHAKTVLEFLERKMATEIPIVDLNELRKTSLALKKINRMADVLKLHCNDETLRPMRRLTLLRHGFRAGDVDDLLPHAEDVAGLELPKPTFTVVLGGRK